MKNYKPLAPYTNRFSHFCIEVRTLSTLLWFSSHSDATDRSMNDNSRAIRAYFEHASEHIASMAKLWFYGQYGGFLMVLWRAQWFLASPIRQTETKWRFNIDRSKRFVSFWIKVKVRFFFLLRAINARYNEQETLLFLFSRTRFYVLQSYGITVSVMQADEKQKLASTIKS